MLGFDINESGQLLSSRIKWQSISICLVHSWWEGLEVKRMTNFLSQKSTVVCRLKLQNVKEIPAAKPLRWQLG